MTTNLGYLKKRLIALDSIELLLGTGNPETINYSQMKLMRDDAFINIGLSLIKAPILTGAWIVESQSQELKDFVQLYFLDRWMTTILTQALTALDFGFSVQEKVVMEEDGYLTFRGFYDIDPEDIIIYTDSYGGYNGIKVTSTTNAGIEVRPEKTFLFTYGKEFGNLYGKSILRKCYTPWYDENLMKLSLLRHLETYGSPLITLYYPPDLDENDTSIYAGTAQQILKNIPYRKAIAIPNIVDERGSQLFKFDIVTGQPRGEGYIDAIRYSNQKKLLGLLVPPQVVLRDEDTGSYAEGVTKLDTLLMMVEGLQKELENHINKYVLKEFVEWNFDTTDEVSIRALPLQNKNREIIINFTEKLLTTGEKLADGDLVTLANEYMKAFYNTNAVPTGEVPAPKGIPDEVSPEEQ